MRIRNKDFKWYTLKKYDGMMGRCYRPTDRSYKTYGAVGIKVCSAWIKDINSFRDWLRNELATMGIEESYFVSNSSKLTLDRIEPNGNYTPFNCRLVDQQTNTRNRKMTKGKTIISAEGETFIFGGTK